MAPPRLLAGSHVQSSCSPQQAAFDKHYEAHLFKKTNNKLVIQVCILIFGFIKLYDGINRLLNFTSGETDVFDAA